MNIERLGIRKQVLYLILVCSLTTLFVAGGIALYGMMKIKADAVEIGLSIGEKAVEKSSEDLKVGAESSMQIIVRERINQINRFFRRLFTTRTSSHNSGKRSRENFRQFAVRKCCKCREYSRTKRISYQCQCAGFSAATQQK